jgi:hypothetical protein
MEYRARATASVAPALDRDRQEGRGYACSICSSEAVFAACQYTTIGMPFQPAPPAAFADLAPTVLFLEGVMGRRAPRGKDHV